MELKTLKGLALHDILTEVHLFVHRGNCGGPWWGGVGRHSCGMATEGVRFSFLCRNSVWPLISSSSDLLLKLCSKPFLVTGAAG